jgi:DNA end-binding protein Ku
MPESVRTFWKGHLRLALVNIEIRLVAAEKTEAKVSFHQVDRKTKQRIKYIKTVPGKGEVNKDDIVMAYEVEPGNYVFMEDSELDAVKLKSRHTVELVQFVDAAEIDPLYFERPYYVLPDGEVAEEGYRVIRDALLAARKIGIGQLTLRGKENLVALYPAGNGRGLLLDTLRYDDEIKDADKIYAAIGTEKSRDDMMEMAVELIEKRTEKFDPEKFKNKYVDALRAMIADKLKKGQTIAVDEEDIGDGGKVVDFMEALKKSVGGLNTPSVAKKSPTKKAPAAHEKKRSRG